MTSGTNKPITMHTSDPSKEHVFYLTVLDDRASAFHIKVGDWTSETVTTPQNGGSPFEELAIEIPANTIPSNNFDVIVYNDFSGNSLYTTEARLAIGKYEGGSSSKATITEIEEPVLSDNYFNLKSYPNPFSSSTTIVYTLPETGNVSIKIYNISGQLVSTLVDEQKPAGEYSVQWNSTNSNGKEVNAGVYFYRVKTGKFVQTKKMLLMK